MSTLLGIVAPPTSRKRLRWVADKLRKRLKWDEAWFPIMEVIETALGDIAPGFVFDVLDRGEMGLNHGLTLVQERRLILREDVYEGACNGQRRDRMTAAHELGHALLHADVALARRIDKEVKTYEDPEWQAKAFAGELLISSQHIGGCRDYRQAAETFGVSEDAARQQMRVFEKEGILLK